MVFSGIENKDEFDLLEFPAESAFTLLDELNLVDILENGQSIRIHPLLREFVLEKIQKENNVQNLMTKSIINLKTKYYDDLSYLVDEYARERDGRDIDSILNDFKTVIEWSKTQKLNKIDQDDSIMNSIYSISKIIEQESHNLRLKDKNSFISSVSDKIDKQLVFVQQIHIRAIDLQQNEIAQRSREYMMMQRKFGSSNT